ncbi:alpha/beta hydrolase-fold protein [Larkinella harenae]
MRTTLVLCVLLFITVQGFCQPKSVASRATPKPFVLGVIDEITSNVLAEKRVLNIYLPEGYNRSDTTRYPVIYLLDGSADEDFIHVVGLVQFNTFSWINRVPKSIVVGIANTNRQRDFTYPTTIEDDKKRFPATGQSDPFIRFIETELQPFIENTYRTTASRTLIGQSLGGLLATQILFQKPALFTSYIIISPSLWWDNGSLLKQMPAILQANFPQKTAVYIGVGKEGLTPGSTPHVMEVDANLLADKLKSAQHKNLTVHFDYLPQEDHATITHQAIFNAFRLLYPASAK